jgi:hypothetical protein
MTKKHLSHYINCTHKFARKWGSSPPLSFPPLPFYPFPFILSLTHLPSPFPFVTGVREACETADAIGEFSAFWTQKNKALVCLIMKIVELVIMSAFEKN